MPQNSVPDCLDPPGGAVDTRSSASGSSVPDLLDLPEGEAVGVHIGVVDAVELHRHRVLHLRLLVHVDDSALGLEPVGLGAQDLDVGALLRADPRLLGLLGLLRRRGALRAQRRARRPPSGRRRRRGEGVERRGGGASEEEPGGGGREAEGEDEGAGLAAGHRRRRRRWCCGRRRPPRRGAAEVRYEQPL